LVESDPATVILHSGGEEFIRKQARLGSPGRARSQESGLLFETTLYESSVSGSNDQAGADSKGMPSEAASWRASAGYQSEIGTPGRRHPSKLA